MFHDTTQDDQTQADNSTDTPPPLSGFRMPDPKVEFQEFKPLLRDLPAPTVFPTSSLVPGFRNVVLKVAHIVQVPEAMAANAVLAVAALVVQGHANVKIDGRVHSINNFFATVAATGDRKDATDDILLGPVYEYQKKLFDQFQADSSKYKNQKAAYEKVRKTAMEENKGGGEESIIEALDRIREPLPPANSLKILSDLTIEGVFKYLASGQPSIGIFATEGGQLLGGYGFAKDNILNTVTGLSKIWDGKPVGRVRSGDGVFVLYNKRVSIHLMIQPVLAPLLIGNPLLSAQGLLSRFLISWPETLAGTRLCSEEDIPERLTLENCPELEAYRFRVNSLLSIPEPLKEGTRNELEPRNLNLTPGALRLWRCFYNDTERQQIKDGRLFLVKGLASKIAEHSARLAGTSALYEDISCDEIDTDIITSGIEVARHYLDEALRLHGSSSVDEKLREAKEMYAWLLGKNKTEISLVEIYQRGPNFLRDARAARAVVQILVEHGVMAPLPGGLEFDGIKRAETYAVRFEV